jgi:hypothetical protein
VAAGQIKQGGCATKFTRKAIHHWGPDRLFAQDDLYTTRWGNISNTEIEQFFFGRLDNEAPSAVDFFCNFDHRSRDFDQKSFRRFMTYMSVQKLRTPKGFAAFQARSKKVGDQRVKVDRRFLQLSPEEPNRTVDEIAKVLSLKDTITTATIREYAPYALLPPLVTLVLGLLGAWVVSGFARKGAG